MAEAGRFDGARSIATVGLSTARWCGVRDHATLLSEALSREGVRSTMHWKDREQDGLATSRAELRAWQQRLDSELTALAPDAILLHYSVFSYAVRGVPVLVRPLLAGLRRAAIPIVTVAHEAAYPWDIGGARGKVWALTQRAALIDVVRASAALLVTADFRAEWLRTRRWLPARRLAVAPVYSNLPMPSPHARADAAADLIGIFGYAYEGALNELALDALARVRRRHRGVRLVLVGAPGEDSAIGRAWRREAVARGVGDALEFSGALPSQELSDTLARCSVLLSINPGGPTQRKGSLAGMLASGVPVVALDGARRWQPLVDEDALRLVPADVAELARAIGQLLDDNPCARALGERGRRFHEQRMSVAVTVAALDRLLRQP